MQERSFGPVRFLPGANQGKYPHCHSLYIEDAGILIDPASERERLKRLRDEEGVKAVWLSHWHEDHITSLDLFADVPLYISAADAPPLGDLEVFLDWYGMEEAYRDEWRGMMASQFNYRPRTPDGFLEPGQTMDLGSVRVELIPVPGHTPGSLAFLFQEPEVLFLADYDLSSFGPWYGDVSSSIPQTIASLERLRATPAKVWLAAHETGVFEEEPGELWDKYLEVVHRRHDALIELLAAPRSLDEIIRAWIVYGRAREPWDFFYFSEGAMIKKHLEYLEEQGRLIRQGDTFRVK